MTTKNIHLLTLSNLFIRAIYFHFQLLQQEYQYLHSLFSTTNSDIHPPFLFVVVIGNPVKTDCEMVTSQLYLSELKSRKLISQSHCVVFDEVVSNIKNFNDSVKYLLQLHPENNILQFFIALVRIFLH